MNRFISPPNQLTLLRILLTPVFVSLFLSTNASFRQWSVIVFVLGMLTDWYDGWVARRWGFVTKWGSYFDPIADKIFISAAFFSFLFVGIVPAWTVWIIVVRDVGITFLRSYSELKGVTFQTSFAAKVKTFAQFVALYYILLAYVGRMAFSPETTVRRIADLIYIQPLIDWMMIGIAVFTVATGIQYLIQNRSLIAKVYEQH